MSHKIFCETSPNASSDVEPCRNVESRSDVEERRLSAASGGIDDRGFSPRGRTSRQTFAAIALLAFAFASAQAQKPTTASPTADLPAGAMQAKATTACLECHEARIILQQRLTKPAWTKEVEKMTKWGAVVDPADRDALIDYLSANFSPEKPPYEPQRTSASGKMSK
jgi:mono/diheme cytochrome c family protein